MDQPARVAAAQDRAIEVIDQDRLRRGPFIENLARALVTDVRDDAGRLIARRATGMVVGLTGVWGLGKSSVINLLEKHLADEKLVAVAKFNPWLFKGRDELLTAFFNELRDAMGRTAGEHARELVAALDKYRAAISAAAHVTAFGVDIAGGSGVASALKAYIAKALSLVVAPRAKTPSEERKALEAKLRKSKVAVVVLIDELDRVEDDEVRTVAQLVKAVGDIEGISYLVAYDPMRVADALGRGTGAERRQTGAAYLEKIIQHPIPLRPLFSDDVDALLAGLLEEHGHAVPENLDENEREIWHHVRDEITTPREVKRLVGAYTVLQRMVGDEISTADLLAYCWILTKTPDLRDVMARDLDLFVDDPNGAETSRRVLARLGKEPQDALEALGPGAAEQELLLRLVFPIFGRTRSERSGDRLSRRRNLVRLLYLGDPPGIASRKDVEALWSVDDAQDLTAQLKELQSIGRLRPIIDRLDDLLPVLPRDGDGVFWPALAGALIRDSDWLKGPEDAGSLADDAASYLLKMGLRGKAQGDRFRAVMSVLEDKGDLVLLPWLLRRHVFAHGLSKHKTGHRPEQTILDRDETEALWTRLVPQLRAAVEDGTLLRRLPHMEVGYALTNRDAWDDDLRANMTAQLEAPEARATFAGLVVPPGYGVDRATLDEMFDCAAVVAMMDAAGEGRKGGTSWIQQSLRRLKRAAAGKDTMFDRDDDAE